MLLAKCTINYDLDKYGFILLIHSRHILSTLSEVTTLQPISYLLLINNEDLAKDQDICDDLNKLISAPNATSLQLRKVNIPETNVYVFCDISGKKTRPLLRRNSLFSPLISPTERFEHINVDIIGPLHSSDKKS